MENDPFCQKVLCKRFPHAKIFGDIREVSGVMLKEVAGGHISLMVGGQRHEEVCMAGEIGEENHFYRGGVRSSDWAQNKAEKAIFRGEIVRPSVCDECGGKNKPYKDGRSSIQAHHDDYNKPLDIRWLCQPCHHAWHKNNVAIELAERPLSVRERAIVRAARMLEMRSSGLRDREIAEAMSVSLGAVTNILSNKKHLKSLGLEYIPGRYKR